MASPFPGVAAYIDAQGLERASTPARHLLPGYFERGAPKALRGGARRTPPFDRCRRDPGIGGRAGYPRHPRTARSRIAVTRGPRPGRNDHRRAGAIIPAHDPIVQVGYSTQHDNRAGSLCRETATIFRDSAIVG